MCFFINFLYFIASRTNNPPKHKIKYIGDLVKITARSENGKIVNLMILSIYLLEKIFSLILSILTINGIVIKINCPTVLGSPKIENTLITSCMVSLP